MLKYRLKVPRAWRLSPGPEEEAFVFLEVVEPRQDAEIRYEGSARLIEEIKLHLVGSHGSRARILRDHATGYDLQSLMMQQIMAPFEPALVEGFRILEPELEKAEALRAQELLRRLTEDAVADEIVTLAEHSARFRETLYDRARSLVSKLPNKEVAKKPHLFEQCASLALGDLNHRGELGIAARSFLKAAAGKKIFPDGSLPVLYDSLWRYEMAGDYLGSNEGRHRYDRLSGLRHSLEWQNGFKGQAYHEENLRLGLDDDSIDLLSRRLLAFPEDRPLLYGKLCHLSALAERQDRPSVTKRLDLVRTALVGVLKREARGADRIGQVNLELIDLVFHGFLNGPNLGQIRNLNRLEWDYLLNRLEFSLENLPEFMQQLQTEHPDQYRFIVEAAERFSDPESK